MSLITNRSRLYDVGKSSGNNQTITYRHSVWTTAQGAATGLRLVYPHVFLNSTGEEDRAENIAGHARGFEGILRTARVAQDERLGPVDTQSPAEYESLVAAVRKAVADLQAALDRGRAA